MMEHVPLLLWFDLNDVRKGNLHVVGDMKHTEVIREEDKLEFVCQEKPEKYDRLLWWDKAEERWREHVVSATESVNGGLTKVTARDVLFELKADFVETLRFDNLSYYDILKTITPLTRFDVGSYGWGGVNQEYAWFVRMSVYDVMRKLETMYNVEFYVDLVVDEDLQRVRYRKLSFKGEFGGWKGKRLTRGKNLPEGELKLKSDEVITAMYGYGASFGAYDEDGNATGGFTRRLTFGSINGGVNYVADERAREKYGRKDSQGFRHHNFGYAIFDDVEKPSPLLQKTAAALQKRNSPTYTYVVDGDNECGIADYLLGEVVLVVDEVSGEPYRCGMRVVKRVRTFGCKPGQLVRFGDIAAGTRSTFATYSQKYGDITNFNDALVKAGLREQDADAMTGALSVKLTLKGAWRTDGEEIDLRYRFDFEQGDIYRFEAEVLNNLSSSIYNVAIACERAGIDETLPYMNGSASKTYSIEVSPTAAEIASGVLVLELSASCPEMFAGTSMHYEACDVSATSIVPPSAKDKPVSTIPDDLTGDGTFENPYTVADLRRCWCASTDESTFEDVWLSGYIVGWADMSPNNGISNSTVHRTATGASSSNIVLADTATAFDASQMCAVNLSTATKKRKAVRAALNLADNPQMLGQKVYVLGDVLRYGRESGMKRTDEYRWCDSSGYWHGYNTLYGELR